MLKYAFKGRGFPKKFEIEIDIDVDTLDRNHVVTNMGDCSIRGVWRPNVGPYWNVRR